ncbi:MAG: helix-turn-helix domain-containing protein [Agriterribacter sp.]
MEIHKKIALARKRKGLTQEQLAELTNITSRTIQRIESGKTVPRAFTIKTIAAALGTSFEELTDHPQEALSSSPVAEHELNVEDEKHFLNTLCLSCFAYLVVPLIHFLLPVYILKRHTNIKAGTRAFARSVIRQQIYWVIALNFLLLLALAYNFIIAVYFKEGHLVNYLWVALLMYILNALFIAIKVFRIKTLDFAGA